MVPSPLEVKVALMHGNGSTRFSSKVNESLALPRKAVIVKMYYPLADGGKAKMSSVVE